ncbi:hypothetical protein [Methanosphaera sp. BMS]|uniref:hypothetical protein n=1 Tax=Methanosphaera sp. BMS TaxID=1789762 RepID=UPI000DC1D70B|nr:hypothetical protein [Methanosphaera sp. BMS]AWX31992.1 hypothetical protein AW729_02275 [Methanosphaera sp. BMS]
MRLCYILQTTKKNITTTVAKSTPTITTSDITASAGEDITLTATITDGDNTINTGKVVFKINGKTVKNSNDKVIYAKVSNNQADITYTIPTSYKAKNYTLTATLISNE